MTSSIEDLLRSPNPEDQREGAFLAAETGMTEVIPLVVDLLHSPSPGVQEAVDMALRRLDGRPTVEALLPFLREENPSARNLAMDILRALAAPHQDALLPLLADPDPDVRIFTADILGSCGDARAVAPLCDALLHDPDVNVRYQAAVSLGQLGYPEAAPALNRALGDDEWVRFAVIEALMKIGHESSIQVLVGALEDSSELVASMIVDALAAMGDRKAAPLLLKRIHDVPGALRNKMLRAIISLLGPKALAWLPQDQRDALHDYLLHALDDEDPEIQDAAMDALAVLGGEMAARRILDIASTLDPDSNAQRLEHAVQVLAALQCTSVLDEALQHGSETQAFIATAAIEHTGNPEAALRLATAFPRQSRDVQRRMAEAMAQLGDKRLTDFFLNVLKETRDGTTLRSALKFLGRTGQPHLAETILPFLLHPYPDVRQVALGACVALGGDQVAAYLETLLKHPDPAIRALAVDGLGQLHPQSPALISMLADPDDTVRHSAVAALAPFVHRDPVRRALLLRTQDESPKVRLALVEALAQTSLQDAHILELLTSMLDDADDWVRIRAMEALGQARATDAVPRIVPMVDGDNPLLAIKAVETLGRMGGQAAMRTLLTALTHPDPHIQAAAERALDALENASHDPYCSQENLS